MTAPEEGRPENQDDVRRFGDQLRPVGVLYVDVYPWRRAPDDRVEFLLVRRRRDVVMPDQWQVLSGKILSQERIADAFVRQVAGKTGNQPSQLHKLEAVNTFYDEHYDTVMLVPAAAAELERDATVELDQSLHIDSCWMSREQATALLPFRAQHDALHVIEQAVLGAGGSSSACQPLPASAFSTQPPPVRQAPGA